MAQFISMQPARGVDYDAAAEEVLAKVCLRILRNHSAICTTLLTLTMIIAHCSDLAAWELQWTATATHGMPMVVCRICKIEGLEPCTDRCTRLLCCHSEGGCALYVLLESGIKV